jgi:hypothetical protein
VVKPSGVPTEKNSVILGEAVTLGMELEVVEPNEIPEVLDVTIGDGVTELGEVWILANGLNTLEGAVLA